MMDTIVNAHNEFRAEVPEIRQVIKQTTQPKHERSLLAPRIIKIKARLINNTRAEFVDQYFYKRLMEIYMAHFDYLDQPDEYKKPFDTDGFWFNGKNAKYFDKQGLLCMSDNQNRTVQMVLRVQLSDDGMTIRTFKIMNN